jgi:hypothetical protein
VRRAGAELFVVRNDFALDARRAHALTCPFVEKPCSPPSRCCTHWQSTTGRGQS